jgi:ribosomal protein L16/L10AE
MGCKLYVDENSTIAAYSLEQARRLAVPHMRNRKAIKIEICIASPPTQLWAYDYDI